MKNKTSKETLKALQLIFKRKYVKEPISMKSDLGGEFKSEFNQWLKDNNIVHLKALPDRHKQLAPVNNITSQVGKLIMTWISSEEMNGVKDPDWTSILDVIREELNKKKRHRKDEDPFTYEPAKIKMEEPPKFRVGSIVYRPIEKPEGVFGSKFRHGDLRYDKTPRKVKLVLIYPNNWRYVLQGFPDVSYAQNELIDASPEKQEKWDLKKIIGERTVKKQKQFLVWWKGYKKAESTWENEKDLREDMGNDLDTYIKEYKDSLKAKKTKTKKKG